MTYHLGSDYFEDPDGIFVSQPKKYIDKLADTYKRLFNEDPPKGYKMAFYWIQSAYNLSDMLSRHWDHPTVYPMILKLLITRGNITLIPREATQEKEKEILNPQPEKLKNNEKENKNMK